MYYGPGMGGWGIALMIGNIIFWGLLVVAAVALIRRTGFGHSHSSSAGVSAQELLAQRFARGEISEEQYVLSLHVLSGPAAPIRQIPPVRPIAGR